ncbi:hypothetical protein [Streptomyces antibioticus]|uniref:hypothetical protein n=1 Tax=Streptomyces antibioticus TaxID=1890 RepID=UPI003F4D0D3A
MRDEHGAAGLPWGSPGERVDRQRQTVKELDLPRGAAGHHRAAGEAEQPVAGYREAAQGRKEEAERNLLIHRVIVTDDRGPPCTAAQVLAKRGNGTASRVRPCWSRSWRTSHR